MSVETINNTPVVRLTKIFLDKICESPTKQFSLTIEDEVYTLIVHKKRRKET